MLTEVADHGVRRHSLPLEWFDTLRAGRGSAAITAGLWRTEHSRRLLLLGTLLTVARDEPAAMGGLGDVSDAMRAVDRARAADAVATDAVLAHPQVGGWLAYTLRRWRGGTTSDLPLWVDVAHLNTLALVASARAGLSWSTRVPVRRENVMLPTLGLARFPGCPAEAYAEADTDGGRIRLRAGGRRVVVPEDATADAEGWWGLRRVTVADRFVLTVCLDDLSPFRDLADPVPPARLSHDDFRRWAGLLADAWRMLCRDHREDAEALADGVVSVAPLPVAEEHWGTRSASTGEAFGAVMLSPPPDAVTTAVSLVHEYQHIKLGALMHLLSLSSEDSGLYYAPWRDDPRPLQGLIQGVYAFAGIAAYWRRHRAVSTGGEAALAGFEFAYARTQTHEALCQIDAVPALTAHGRALVDGLLARCTPWLDEPLPAELVRLATLTADAHRTGWRLRHWRPAPEDVARLAASFRAGEAPTGPVAAPRTSGHPDRYRPQRIPVLARRRAFAGPSAGDRAGADATPLDAADAALVAGDGAAARGEYLRALAGSAEDVRAWVGLALALPANDASSALASRPDLVSGVYRELTASGASVEPVALATWLAGTLPG